MTKETFKRFMRKADQTGSYSLFWYLMNAQMEGFDVSLEVDEDEDGEDYTKLYIFDTTILGKAMPILDIVGSIDWMYLKGDFR